MPCHRSRPCPARRARRVEASRAATAALNSGRYTPDSQRFNPLSLSSGAWPSGPDQIDIDAATASKQSFSVGQQIATAVLGGVLGFASLVLIFRLGSFREVIERGKAHRREEAKGRSQPEPDEAAGRARPEPEPEKLDAPVIFG